MRVLLPVLFVVLVAGCGLFGFETEGYPQLAPPRTLTAQETAIVAADNAFGFDLVRALSADAPGANLFVSPLSVSMALGMTLNGAEGETRAEMEAMLHKHGLTRAEINAAYRSLIDLLEGLDPRVTFEIANSIWHREGFSVEADFIEANRQFFDAEVAALDFNTPSAVERINGWVDEKTRGKIDTIIDQIGPDAVMYLINAIYFKGTWTYEFEEAETREAPFHLADGSVTTVPLMHQGADLPYLATDRFRAVDLPYGDSLYSMTVLLPNEGLTPAEIVADLDAEAWAAWSAGFQVRGVELALPRFRLEYKQTLNGVLQALGMEAAFAPALSDFSGINPARDDLHISQVLHKTFLEVNEEGTEAAAVTVVEMSVTCAGCGGAGISFVVDRPFVLLIRERHSGTILFAGQVMNPNA